jgi:hypothetical protein
VGAAAKDIDENAWSILPAIRAGYDDEKFRHEVQEVREEYVYQLIH